MTIYARSDLAAVYVSPAHGGCGTPGGHSRPVENGAPAKLWRLDCPACEDHLRGDPLWSSTLSEIPETHDERKAREDFDKRGAKDRDQIMALALAKLAGVELPETMQRPITGNLPHIPEAVKQSVALCPEGHANRADARWCNDCGAKMGEAAEPPAPAAQSAPEPPAEPAPAPTDPGPPVPVSAPPGVPWPSNTAMRNADKPNLARIAREHGLDDSGTRADLLNRLIEAANAAR